MENEIDTSNEAREEAALMSKIAEQNDRFRNTWGTDFTVPGQIMITRGIADLAPEVKAIVMQRVQTFDAFSEDNDPYGDHSFGAFEVELTGNSYHLFWKVDLYDTDYRMGSENPGNPEVTRRVLTIMHASEY